MNSTKYFGLCQWDPEDRILREDFNANSEITDTILAALDDELQEKLETPELIANYPGNGQSVNGMALSLPSMDWNEWNYVVMVVHYPETEPGEHPLQITLSGGEGSEKTVLKKLCTPCYALLFLPRHDSSSQVTGFALGNYLLPFRCSFTYEELVRPEVMVADYVNLLRPNTTYIGVR